MAKVNLTEEVDKKEAALVPIQKQELASHPVQNLPSGVIGEWDSTDQTHPKINLVAKTGPLSNVFPGGSYVINQEHQFADGKKPFTMMVHSIEKLFIEDTEYGGDEMPRIFTRAADVRANGGAVTWEDQKSDPSLALFKAAARLIVVIESDKEDTFFPIDIDGKYYTIASWLMAKSAYNSAGKKIFNDAMYYLRGGLLTGSYKVTSEIKTNDKGSWFVPKLVNGGKTSSNFVDAIHNILG